MIYHRFGEVLKVIGYCGTHHAPYLRYPALLLEVEYEGGEKGFQWGDFLKADGGFTEIAEAAGGAPKKQLTDLELELAFHSAE